MANGFALDDTNDLLENRFVTGRLDLAGIFGSDYYGGWGYMATGHYRPLLNLTYKAVAAAFGLRPEPYHALNVVLFALVVALTVEVVSRMADDKRVGALAGLIFAVHPVVSESVAALVGLKELAAAGLGLWSVRCIGQGRSASGFASFVAALLFKESALAFLPIAAAAEILHPEAPSLRRAARVWPLAAGAVVVLALRAAVTGGLFRPTAVGPVDNPLVLLETPLQQLAAVGLLGRYLALFAWPACLSSDYAQGSLPLPESAADPWIVSSLAIVAGIMALLVWTIRRRMRVAAFGIVAFAASYLLVSNVVVVIGTIMAERLFFLPAWALSIAAAGLLVAGHDRLPPSAAVRRKAMGVAIGATLAVLAARTWVRIGDWKDSATLAQAVHRCYPDNVKVLVALAETQARLGRHEQARALYDRAVAIGPDPYYAQAALGVYLLERGEPDRAIPLLEACAASQTPISGPALKLALLYLERGRDDDAFRTATLALETGPSYAGAALAHVVRGEVFLRRGDAVEAVNAYRSAIRDDPGAAAAHFNLGRILEAQGRLEEALEEQLRAERLAPKDPRVLYARAVVEAKLDRLDRSLETIERLRALDPAFPPARRHWARLQLVLGDRARAAGDFPDARRRYDAVVATPDVGELGEEARRRLGIRDSKEPEGPR